MVENFNYLLRVIAFVTGCPNLGYPEEQSLARIGIIGVGAIGSAVAALLQESGRHELDAQSLTLPIRHPEQDCEDCLRIQLLTPGNIEKPLWSSQSGYGLAKRYMHN
jgi:hypothetical protein